MSYSATDLGEYAEALYQAENFGQAFTLFEKQVLKLGFDAVLYTYIPRVLLNSNFSREPVYHISKEYCPSFIKHYFDARFDRCDPVIKAINNGTMEPIDWWGRISKKYMDMDSASKNVIATSREYGIANGITLPLMSGEKGVAGASFISREKRLYSTLKDENLSRLRVCTMLFHNMVSSNACLIGQFVKPVLGVLNKTEKQFLCLLAQGKSPAQIASTMGKSEKYLEQVMLRMRRKLSGVEADGLPVINRNQILYYAGLINLIEYLE